MRVQQIYVKEKEVPLGTRGSVDYEYESSDEKILANLFLKCS